MSTHNIGFYEDLTKIIFELSSNMHLISSADLPICLRNLRTTCSGKLLLLLMNRDRSPPLQYSIMRYI